MSDGRDVPLTRRGYRGWGVGGDERREGEEGLLAVLYGKRREMGQSGRGRMVVMMGLVVVGMAPLIRWKV